MTTDQLCRETEAAYVRTLEQSVRDEQERHDATVKELTAQLGTLAHERNKLQAEIERLRKSVAELSRDPRPTEWDLDDVLPDIARAIGARTTVDGVRGGGSDVALLPSGRIPVEVDGPAFELEVPVGSDAGLDSGVTGDVRVVGLVVVVD